MKEKKPYYITTAIAYTSGRPHIGNTYEIVLTDAIARYKRQQGYEVFFQTGTDEHGQKIEEKAKEAGVTPKQFVDDVAGIIRQNFDMMNTSYDYFIRTTDESHENCTNREIFIRERMRECIVRRVSLSGQRASLWMENVRTAADRYRKQPRKRISLICRNMHRV